MKREATDDGPWLRDRALVYRLVQTGWRNGKPVFENEVEITVTAGRTLGRNQQAAERMAEEVRQLLNENASRLRGPNA